MPEPAPYDRSRHRQRRAAGQRDTERFTDTRTAPQALTEPALGDRSEAWPVALTLLPDFTAPLPHLLIAADGITADVTRASHPLRSPAPRDRNVPT
ncbi:hypothetical protein [Yinghuangia sp. YIM S09857]|uniref:hypothetical protein n=1 Tax=Yinghuangia sp. YIM S09857 TaxID=3436929 RepID=UPI003F52E83D